MSAVRFDFGGQVVMVTGVGRVGQIGHAAARAFGEAGAQLVLCDLNAVAVAERAREFEAAGIAARPAAGDLTEPDVAQFAVATALEAFGRLDAVVNIAGGLTTWGPIAGTSLRDFDREIAINLKTTFVVSQASIDALAQSGGCLLNVASIAYVQPQANMAVYTAAKAAVAGFTRSLALELFDRGVRVNAIAPGMVRTSDNVATAGDEAHYVEMHHITDGLLFLASPAAHAITGHILPITRGRV
jgi:NAD(P)-dependent dehydrogenase (short-subunit alcohol dehydrogenase family)